MSRGTAGARWVPLTRADCVVCDDLGCEFCPHRVGGEVEYPGY